MTAPHLTNLVLSLRLGETVTVGDFKLTFVEYDTDHRALFAIEAPREVTIQRESAAKRASRS